MLSQLLWQCMHVLSHCLRAAAALPSAAKQRIERFKDCLEADVCPDDLLEIPSGAFQVPTNS